MPKTNPNKNPKRTFYRRPTATATKAEEAKQNGRILRYRAKLMKDAKSKMVVFMRKENAKMIAFKKGKKTTATITPGAAKKAAKKPSGKKGTLGFRSVDDLFAGFSL
ncbi:MAG: hypothetical protein K8953_05280 [Proteobacteria bacterium]|nr:hypothetical protein [Pseudomonadota bacterium]